MHIFSFRYLYAIVIVLFPLVIFCDENPTIPDTLLPENPDEENQFYYQFLHMLTILGAILFFLFGSTWFLKKFFNNRILQANNSGSINVVERRQLTPKTTLYVLDVGGKGILVAESIQGHLAMTDVPLPTESNVKEQNPPYFTLDKK